MNHKIYITYIPYIIIRIPFFNASAGGVVRF